MSETTLIEKLSIIASEAGNIKKNGWNSHQSYKYLKIDDIYDHFSKVMSLHNVVFSTTIKNYQIVDRLIHGVVVGEFKTSNETFICEVGSAASVNDKMMRNFMQNAVKQIFLQVFLISSGDPDPDGEPELTPQQKPQIKWISLKEDSFMKKLPELTKRWDGEIVLDNEKGKGIKVDNHHIFLTTAQFEILGDSKLELS